MRTTFDPKQDTFNVSITKQELQKAFKSTNELQQLLHNIVSTTYGEPLANELFPINAERR